MNTAAEFNRLRAQLAVMSIFRNLSVPPGDPLFIGELSLHWSGFGIRASDLTVALDDLARKGLISRRPETPDQIAQTPAGEKWFRDQPAWMEYQLIVPRAARAAYLREQAERKPASARRRRREDRPALRGTA